MVFNDRLKRAFYTLFKASVPRLDYYALYTAKVVQQQANGLFDLAPDDSRLPSMGGVSMRLGVPGGIVSVQNGATVLVGWENADPSRPFCALFDGTEHVFKLTITADQIFLGSVDGAEPAARGQTLQAYLNQLAIALTTHVHGGVTTGGGVSAVAPLLASITPPTVTATKVNVA